MLVSHQKNYNKMSDYLKPNITVDQSIEIIREKIKTNTPFSFTRFGDGEIYILNRNGYKFKDWEKRICNDWGYEFPEGIGKAYDEIGEVVKYSFLNTDMIGIMSENHEIFKVPGMEFKSDSWSISIEKLQEIGIYKENLLIGEHMLPRYKEFGNILEFSKIINGNDIHIISPRTYELKNKNIDEILHVNVNYTHHGYDINVNNRESIFKTFDKIKEPIVILGTSVLKDYGPILSKEFGKIALDFGATLDAWSGIYSRPWFKKGNLQDYLLIE